MLMLLAMLALSVAAGGAILEMTCDKAARQAGWCYSEQEGQQITVFGVGVTGPAEAQCPHGKADKPECQAARMVAALSRTWSASVMCSQPLVDAGVCHRTMIGKSVGNPTSQRQFADREMRALWWQIVSGEWKRMETERMGEPPPLAMDGKAPP